MHDRAIVLSRRLAYKRAVRPRLLQVQATVTYHNGLIAQIGRSGLDRSIGSMVGGVQLTLSGMVAGAHLVGMGNLQAFVNSGGATIPRDGNKVPITSYIAAFGGCDMGSTAATFAAVKVAGGGAGVGVPPRLPPASGVPAAPAPLAWDPSTAFSMASGQRAIDVRQAIAAIAATLLTLWLAWTAQACFFAWSKRRMSFFAMKADVIRGCVLLSLVIVILQ